MAKKEPLKKQIKSLREQIAEMDRLYYQQNRPAMADMEYDFLKKQLEALEQANPDVTAELDKRKTSPTAKVGSDLTGEMPTIRHGIPMLSLENSYNRVELDGFDSRLRRALKLSEGEGAALEYVVEPKIDGLSINVVYENGRLVRAVTRGDGEEGEVVTQNFLTIAGVPRQWPGIAPQLVELRGEVYMTYEQFQRVNAQREADGEESYANPRNLAAGTLKLKDNTEEVCRRGLRAIFYGLGLVQGEENPEWGRRHSEFLEFLVKNNFPTQAKWWRCSGIQAVWRAIEEMDTLRKKFAYPTDGAVIKLDDIALRETAGWTARAPRWAFAYKYLPERAETKLEKITVQVGRTGVLTPVAELTPVELSGSMVARATLHNSDEIARKDIREGDCVIIEKAGEVIPAVVSIVMEKRSPDSRAFEFPRECPACGSLVMRIEGEVAVRCVNPECPAQRKRALEHFASRNAMAIDGMGEAVVEQLVDKGFVKTIADVYRLGLKDFLKLEGFAEKSAMNLFTSLEASKQNDLWRVIHALGIPQVGETVSQLLAVEFGTLENLQSASKERLMEVAGIGENMADSIVKFFSNNERHRMIEAMRHAGVNMIVHEGKKVVDGPLKGKKFVLTGELQNFTRSQAKGRLEALGGKVVDKVSRGVEAVIVGEAPGSKLQEARNLGVRIISEAEFEEMVGHTTQS